LNDDVKAELKGLLLEVSQGSVDKAVKESEASLEAKFESKIADLKDTLMSIHRKSDQGQDEEYATFVANVVKAKGGDAKAKAALQEGTDSEGGYFVPDGFEARIIREAYQASVFAMRAQTIPMSERLIEIPKMGTAVSVVWTAEEVAATESEPTLGIVQLTAQRLDAYSQISNELLADSRVDVIDWLTKEFSEAIALELDNQCFNGTGSPCSGILTATAGYSVVMAAGETNFSAVTADDLSEMISKITTASAAGASFWLHRSVLHYLRTLKDSNNDYIWARPADSQPGTIWGYPYALSDKMVATSASAASTAFMAFGNPKNFLLGRRMGISVDISEHVYFLNFQSAFRVVSRWAPKMGLNTGFCRLVTGA